MQSAHLASGTGRSRTTLANAVASAMREALGPEKHQKIIIVLRGVKLSEDGEYEVDIDFILVDEEDEELEVSEVNRSAEAGKLELDFLEAMHAREEQRRAEEEKARRAAEEQSKQLREDIEKELNDLQNTIKDMQENNIPSAETPVVAPSVPVAPAPDISSAPSYSPPDFEVYVSPEAAQSFYDHTGYTAYTMDDVQRKKWTDKFPMFMMSDSHRVDTPAPEV